jgi:uncharacterized membrane protein (DUF373 family)
LIGPPRSATNDDGPARGRRIEMSTSKRLWHAFDRLVLAVLEGILAIGIVAAIGIVVLLLFRGLPQAAENIDNIGDLQAAIQALFAGVLLVVLGLELMDTLRNYFIEHRLRVELLISVALIAVARHVIQLDYEHSDPWLVAAMALLVLALTASYVGVRVFIRNGRSDGASSADGTSGSSNT